MYVKQHNRAAWDRYVNRGNRWTVPVSPEAVAAAREGRFELLLTPSRPVPGEWFPPLPGLNVLCLAGDGGQLAAGLVLTGFYEDRVVAEDHLVSRYMPTFMATRAVTPS